MDDDSDHKLYAKVMCSMCLGGERDGMFMNCPYCDINRKTFVEASFKTIKESLNTLLSSDQKKDLREFLCNGTGSNNNYF